ncbi:2'-5' RNA ligase family protein [Nocardioides sp. TRM66260-LWL]|uniref:2'-5' RNA ligase family protein n=1 Tax=Nocardioides sp. TRM66260-LWL TaxID=2874478 RepID=UPI001CC75C4D|nr:2'-5' RNA ligase family protein [Nocardioides sp. TRM66260-LWL]
MLTIGVAVAVPEPWGTRLQEYRTGLGDDTASLIPTHITLVPPQEIAEESIDAVRTHLAEVGAAIPRFGVHLRGTGTFRPVSPVVFVTLAEGISPCEQLAEALRDGPLGVELDFPYHPHVTVAHHLDDPTLDRAFEELGDFECEFTVEEFHLYVHDARHGWRPTDAFALRTPPEGV